MVATQETIDTLEEATGKYKYGFVTDIDSDKAPKGLNEDIIVSFQPRRMSHNGCLIGA